MQGIQRIGKAGRAGHTLIVCLLALWTLIGSSGRAAAQDNTPLRAEPLRLETFVGDVPFAGTYVQTFEAIAGDTLTITARAVSRDFDPRLTVRTIDGAFIGGNDDNPIPDPTLTAKDSRLIGLVVPADGSYTIEVSGLNAVGGGIEVTLRWTVDQAFEVTRERALAAAFADPISADMQVVKVGSWDRYTHVLDATRGDVYSFYARGLSGDIDTRMALYYEDTLLIDANDDHGSSDVSMGSGDARLLNVMMPRDGRYYVEVRGYEATTGDVSFTVELVARGALVYPGTDTQFEGTIEVDAQVTHTFEARVGDYVTLTAAAHDPLLDPIITLIDPDGERMIDNDNHGYNDADIDFFDARIKNVLIQQSGIYTVEVASARGGEGAYTLTVNTKRDRRLFEREYTMPEMGS